MPEHRAAKTHNPPLVSVVIASWNRKRDLDFVLRKLAAQDYRPLEIIVADNNSTDGTREMLAARHPDVKLIALEENIGVAAYNRGAAVARGEFVVLLDNDSYPGPEAITDMVRAFRADGGIGIVAFDFRAHRAARSHGGGGGAPLDTATETYAFSGGGAGIRREILADEELYPEEFFIYWNELDFAIRAMTRGWKIVHFAGIPAYHIASGSSRSRELVAYYHVRNLVWIYAKFFPADEACANIRELLALALFNSVARREKVYTRAWFDAVRRLPEILAQRKPAGKDILDKIKISRPLAFVGVRGAAPAPPDRKVAQKFSAARRCLIIRSSNLQHIAPLPGLLKKMSPGMEIFMLTHARAAKSVKKIKGVDNIIEWPGGGDFSDGGAREIQRAAGGAKFDVAIVPFAAPDSLGYENVIALAAKLGRGGIILYDGAGNMTWLDRRAAENHISSALAPRRAADAAAAASEPFIRAWFAAAWKSAAQTPKKTRK